jgi:FAD/FMN-containing dehydrogenase
MLLTSWGQYPIIPAQVLNVSTSQEITKIFSLEKPLIPRGFGRSYGDSALAENVVCLRSMDRFSSFDNDTGVLVCQAGVSLADILETFVTRGWFLPVTPGTKFVTVGGAIASDVHGKNHHIHGCFSEYVSSLELMLADGSIVECSRTSHAELFHATCGGMGLTGVILSATLSLKKIESTFINETISKAENLEEVFLLFEQNKHVTYSVAWIDCLARGKSLGRSLLMLGEHAQEGGLTPGKNKKLTIPCNMPSSLLNQYSIAAFNALYFNKQREKTRSHLVHYDTFFYPLDGLNHWNRLYGKNGFTQYQFLLPTSAGLKGMTAVLQKITASRRGSFLSVLKACGPANKNPLSFPIEGYSLALDFKIEAGLFELLNQLDEIVLHYGGRIYLTKDVRMSESTFKQSYPQWQTFETIRKHYGADKKFHSLQSQRLGL